MLCFSTYEYPLVERSILIDLIRVGSELLIAVILAYRLHKSEDALYCIVCFFAWTLMKSGWIADIKWSKLNFYFEQSIASYIVYGFPCKFIMKYSIHVSA